MNDSEEAPDSQPDTTNDTAITWNDIEREKNVMTRKEKQLDKLHKDLYPLTKEFEDIPVSKIRHSSFQKNNQFTVLTAEFLNLSSKNELNNLFESGYSKEEIENMLENKYQEKKSFFTTSGIKKHKFRRKNFSSWITMTNSHFASTNTFMSEEELLIQLDKHQKLQLKRINSKPLKRFLKKEIILNTSIPAESGILPSSKNTGVDSFTREDIQPEEKKQFPQIASKIDTTENDEELFEQDARDNDVASDLSSVQELNTEITSPILHVEPNSIENIPSSGDDSTTDLPENDFQLNNIVPTSPPSIPLNVQSEPHSNGRSLRNRTIVNRNPYLVDRAQFYGLATKNELLHLEERGLTEDEIIQYLEKEFQKGRNKSIGGYKTFLELINDQKADKTNIHEDTQTFEPPISDMDTDFSLDEDEPVIEADEERPSDNNDSYENEVKLIYEYQIQKDHNSGNFATKSKRSKKPQYSNTLSSLTLTPEVEPQTNSKHRKIKTTVEKMLESVEPRILTGSSEDPYNLDFLTLSDDEMSKDVSSKYHEVGPISDDIISSDHIDSRVDNDNYGRKSDFSTSLAQTFKNNQIKKPRLTTNGSVLKRLGNSLIVGGNKKRKLVMEGTKNSDHHSDKGNLPNHRHIEHKNPVKSKDVIGGYYIPITDSSFMFSRKPNEQTVQLERNTKQITNNEIIQSVVSLDIQNAKNTLTIANRASEKESDETKLFQEKIIQKWNSLNEMKIEDKRLNFILRLKRDGFDDFSYNDKLSKSPLIERTLDSADIFYRKKNIKLEFMGSCITFDVPLKSDSLSKIVAFLNLLYGSIVDKKLTKQHLKHLRKALIYIMMVISNIKQDCPNLIDKIGLELNHFLNKIKKLETDKLIMCNITIFHTYYFIVILKSLSPTSELYTSFTNSKKWLESKYFEYFLGIPFEQIFINKKPILLSTLELFMKSREFDDKIMPSDLNLCRIDVLNLINLFYFMNTRRSYKQSWNIVFPILNFYGDSKNCISSQLTQIKGIFIFVHKLCFDWKWNIENELLIKLFRILAENKFENIGSLVTPKPTLYPNSVATVGLMVEDGCLDIYFKILELFSRQYMTESSKSVIERLIPVRTTFEYNDIQLQNRAKVLLIMSSVFDQDLSNAIESILMDMIRNGTAYSIRASLGLLQTLVKFSSRKPYALIKKFLPLLIKKVNTNNINDGIRNILKDLIMCVKVLLDGEDVSYLIRLLDFVTIILQLQTSNNDSILTSAYNHVFDLVMKQFEFLSFVEVSAKDKKRIDKKLHEIISLAKIRLTENSQFLDSIEVYLKFWVFSSSKLNQPVAQLVYSEWYYFSDEKFRNRYEINFFELVTQYFEFTPVIEEIFVVLFRNIATGSKDTSMLLTILASKSVISLESSIHNMLKSKTLLANKYSITRACLASLFKMNNDKLIEKVMREFFSTLKSEYQNFHSRDYVKETCVYIYNVNHSSKKYDFPDWDFLVEELNLGNMMHSITRKLQFIHSIDDISIIFEKAYISNVLNQTLEKFEDQFVKFTLNSSSFNENIVSLCAIISYHVNEIVKLNDTHWIHLEHWVRYFADYCQALTSKVSIESILNLLLVLSKHKKLFVTHYKYRYYYYKIICHVYRLLDWITSMFVGFSDFSKWCRSIFLFASIDYNVHLEAPNVNSNNNIELEKKLHHLFSSLITQEKLTLVTDEKKIYDLEMELPLLQEKLIEKWGIKKSWEGSVFK